MSLLERTASNITAVLPCKKDSPPSSHETHGIGDWLLMIGVGRTTVIDPRNLRYTTNALTISSNQEERRQGTSKVAVCQRTFRNLMPYLQLPKTCCYDRQV